MSASAELRQEPARVGFLDSLGIQMRVLGALILREISETTGRNGYKLVFGIAEPILAISIAIIWHTLLRVQPPYGHSRVLFISSGLFSTYLFVHMSCEFRSLSKNSFSVRRFPCESTIDAVLATCLIKLVTYGFTGVLGGIIIYCFFTEEADPSNWNALLLGLLSLSVLGLGMGLVNAAIEQLTPLWRYVWNPIARGLILFSGVIYVPDFLRTDIREWLSWNPVMQGVELVRQGFYLNYPQTIFRPFYLWTFAVTLVLAGLCMDRAFRRLLDEH